MNSYFLLCITYRGEDWEREEYEVFTTEDEMNNAISCEKAATNGDTILSFDFEMKTDEELRGIITVEEYCSLHPGLEKYLKNNYGK